LIAIGFEWWRKASIQQSLQIIPLADLVDT